MLFIMRTLINHVLSINPSANLGDLKFMWFPIGQSVLAESEALGVDNYLLRKRTIKVGTRLVLLLERMVQEKMNIEGLTI